MGLVLLRVNVRLNHCRVINFITGTADSRFYYINTGRQISKIKILLISASVPGGITLWNSYRYSIFGNDSNGCNRSTISAATVGSGTAR